MQACTYVVTSPRRPLTHGPQIQPLARLPNCLFLLAQGSGLVWGFRSRADVGAFGQTSRGAEVVLSSSCLEESGDSRTQGQCELLVGLLCFPWTKA